MRESAFAGEFGLDIDIEHSEDYWFEMCTQVERVLLNYGVESNGCAEGDYPLGKYVSLRNEAFVRDHSGNSIYPPNKEGWNPLRHPLPIDLKRFRSISPQGDRESPLAIRYRSLLLVGLALITIGLWFRMRKAPLK
jgi:hypothetical protein